MIIEGLDKGQTFIWEWQYRTLGGFDSTLAEALSKADGGNRDKLRKGYPEYADAMDSFQHDSGWWQRCQDIVKWFETNKEQEAISW